MSDEQSDELTERQRLWLLHLRACKVLGQTSMFAPFTGDNLDYANNWTMPGSVI
jgi:hypothetical protein